MNDPPRDLSRPKPTTPSVTEHAASKSTTPEQELPEDVKALLFRLARLVYRRFGRSGLLVAVILILVSLAWWNWDHIRNLPGMPELLFRISEASKQRIPDVTPNPGELAVAIVHLNNDQNAAMENLITSKLELNEKVVVHRIDEIISPSYGSAPEKKGDQGDVKALQYLQESKADVLIWGTAGTVPGGSVAYIHWVTRRGLIAGTGYIFVQLNVSDNFWTDFESVLFVCAPDLGRRDQTVASLEPLDSTVRKSVSPAIGRGN